ncbi:MAG: C4-dicarboxylate ABC transporter [Nitrosomonas sp.]|nr:MAG: C4-dicarboxylate ABC transporter [Nitrosomonas sp.]
MTTNQVFLIVALLIAGVFFGGLSMVGLPQSLMEWVITDGVFAVSLYISYLVVAAIKGPSKPKFH